MINSISNRLDREISNIVKRSSADKTYITPVKDITYADFLADKMMMIFVIREGVPYSLFNLIQDQTPFTEDNWADFLDLSTKSLQRYKQTDKTFKSISLNRLLR